MSALAHCRTAIAASVQRLRLPIVKAANAARTFSTSHAVRSEEQGGKHVPFGELGSGYYSDNTKGCYDVIANATPMMLEACSAVLDARKQRGAAANEEPFVIADYGAADAGTSLPMMHKLVEHIRKHEPNTHVVLAYEDQPMNDWTSVFLRLQGEIASDPGLDHHTGMGSLPCIMDRFEGVTISATGVSFYKPCYPPKSVDLMFSATAMHWFRKTPIAMEKVLHSAMLERSDKEFKTYWDMAAEDWKIILRERSKELKPGGRFGCVSFAKNEQGHFLGHSGHVKESMHHCFRDIWADMASAGRITKAEFEATNFPNQYRCMEEYLAPFGGEGAKTDLGAGILQSAVKGKAAFEGLVVAAASYGEVRCPYHERWMREKAQRKEQGVDEAAAAAAHATRFVPTTRTWSNSTFESGLAEGRSVAERQERSNELFGTYEAMVAKNPEQHAMDYQHVYLVMHKD